IDLREDGLGAPGEAWLFGAVLDEFFAQGVTLNSFSRLSVTCQPSGEVHAWPARLGRRRLL
ncbi:MAG: type VI secretion system baseplate subunit TssF, partial [Planctomycetes bacterium]|nr:type VI secretion system baseplate subunit TssF [Planctomycetota bacterium]